MRGIFNYFKDCYMKYDILLRLRIELVSIDKSIEFVIIKNFLGENVGDFYM